MLSGEVAATIRCKITTEVNEGVQANDLNRSRQRVNAAGSTFQSGRPSGLLLLKSIFKSHRQVRIETTFGVLFRCLIFQALM
jgi:hypothetical protein